MAAIIARGLPSRSSELPAPPPLGAGVISYRTEDRTLEIRAKDEFVKNINPATGNPGGPQAQSYRPDRVRPLLRDLQMELERFQRRQIQYDELGRYAGQGASTVFNKLQKNDHPQIEALLGWLERLPEEVRCGILGKFWRCFPSLEHKRLGHDPVQVSSMKALLRQPAGLTFATGSNAGVRTFVTSALGHGSLMLGPADTTRTCFDLAGLLSPAGTNLPVRYAPRRPARVGVYWVAPEDLLHNAIETVLTRADGGVKGRHPRAVDLRDQASLEDYPFTPFTLFNV
jgi:hypothetical protein